MAEKEAPVARSLLAGGSSAILTGAAVFLPVVAARMERGQMTGVGTAVVSVGGVLIAGGLAAAWAGFRRPRVMRPRRSTSAFGRGRQ